MRPPIGRRAADRESGQVLPILIVGMCFVLIVGFLLYTVGAAARLKTEGQTAADAGALAGEENVKRQLLRMISAGTITPENIDWLEVEAAARDYAKRNDGTVTDFQHLLFDVRVTVRSDRGLDGEKVGRDDARAISKARASLGASYAISAALGGAPAGGAPAVGGGGGAGGPNPIPEAELEAIEKAAGVKIRSDSALRRYAGLGNGDGPNVAQLSTPMKISIAKAEDLMGSPLIINSAYRSAAYQAVLCGQVSGRCAPPGQSLHNFGLAIDVANYPQLAAVAAKAGLCQPFPAPGDDNVHFSPADGPECGGQSGPLGAGQAFGGNPLSFVSYDVRLVPYDGS